MLKNVLALLLAELAAGVRTSGSSLLQLSAAQSPENKGGADQKESETTPVAAAPTTTAPASAEASDDAEAPAEAPEVFVEALEPDDGRYEKGTIVMIDCEQSEVRDATLKKSRRWSNSIFSKKVHILKTKFKK